MPHVRPESVVEDALRCSDEGMPDSENAALHDVAVKTIRRWRRVYQRQGRPRGQAHTTARCPRCNEGELAAPAYAEFTNYSADIRELCCWALDLAEVPRRQSNTHTISVSTRAAVARLDRLIGPKA